MTTKTKPRTRLDHILDQPWALYPQTLSRIVEWARGAAEADVDPATIVALNGTHDATAAGSVVAVIPVYGVIEQHSDWFMEMFGEGTSVDGLRDSLRAALADPDVKAIVLDIDSPGGTVAGITELAAEIRGVRGGDKPIVASANAFCASAAYWLASQCDEVTATPSAQVGSIGVYAVHQDVSRMLDELGVTVTLVSAGPHKTEGNMYEPLSDEAKADMQSRVDDTYTTFKADVAAGRRISADQVESDFGGGRVMTAKKAAAAGMVDRVETLGATITRLASAGGRRRAVGAAAAALAAAAAGELTPSHIRDMALAAAADGCDYEFDDGAPCDLEMGHEGEHQKGVAEGSTTALAFTDRLTALATEADAIVEHATERARLRGKEGRPALSTTTERSLRSIRGAIDALLEPAEPAASTAPPDPVEPAPVVQSAPPSAAPPPVRFASRDAWLHFLETH